MVDASLKGHVCKCRVCLAILKEGRNSVLRTCIIDALWSRQRPSTRMLMQVPGIFLVLDAAKANQMAESTVKRMLLIRRRAV